MISFSSSELSCLFIFSESVSHMNNKLFELNPNIVETNLFNILILIGILIYAYQKIFQPTLEKRREEIVKRVENAQQEIVLATQSYDFAEKALTQSIFTFQLWKELYEQEKTELITQKYNQLSVLLKENFQLSDSLITALEKKASTELQQYVLFLSASLILRKFYALSEEEQSKFIEVNITLLLNRKY